ncbi:MAG: hypothetical protein HY714_01605 [Candidatus Omnitrophica bacterium]|nr:hypothetical protein [Candidatus Omnitrophota bacterium]
MKKSVWMVLALWMVAGLFSFVPVSMAGEHGGSTMEHGGSAMEHGGSAMKKTEDANGNGVLDAGEDVNNNGAIDELDAEGKPVAAAEAAK